MLVTWVLGAAACTKQDTRQEPEPSTKPSPPTAPATPSDGSCTPTDAPFVEHGAIQLRLSFDAMGRLGPQLVQDSWVDEPRKLKDDLPWLDAVEVAEGTLLVTTPEGLRHADAWASAPIAEIDAPLIDQAIGWASHIRVRMTPKSASVADRIGAPWMEQVDDDARAICHELRSVLPEGAQCGAAGGSWVVVRRSSSKAVVLDAFQLLGLMRLEREPASWAPSHGKALRARVEVGMCAEAGDRAVPDAPTFQSVDDAAAEAFRRTRDTTAALWAIVTVTASQRTIMAEMGAKYVEYGPRNRARAQRGAVEAEAEHGAAALGRRPRSAAGCDGVAGAAGHPRPAARPRGGVRAGRLPGVPRNTHR